MGYKLTRGTVSIIRHDPEGIAEAERRGFVYVGKCDKDGNQTDGDAPKPLPQEIKPVACPSTGRKGRK